MNTIRNLLTNLRTLLCCVRETLGYALIFLWAIICPKAVLAAKLLAGESQLAVCKHQIGQRKRRRPKHNRFHLLRLPRPSNFRPRYKLTLHFWVFLITVTAALFY